MVVPLFKSNLFSGFTAEKGCPRQVANLEFFHTIPTDPGDLADDDVKACLWGPE